MRTPDARTPDTTTRDTTTRETGGIPAVTAPRGYVFDNDSPHSARHHASLEGALDPLTLGHLRDAGVSPGMRCLEVGAGAAQPPGPGRLARTDGGHQRR
ncbi:hypothetical protein ACWDNT_33810, partial [Streptomyces sp. NPDC000963]